LYDISVGCDKQIKNTGLKLGYHKQAIVVPSA